MDKSPLLTDLSPYIYGTTRLGDEKIPFDERVNIAKAAMAKVDWFHTSHTYGDALKVLRTAFDQDRSSRQHARPIHGKDGRTDNGERIDYNR